MSTGQNGEKTAYKHTREQVYLHADTRTCCHGNWHISSEIEGGTTYYWASKSEELHSSTQFYVGSTSPPEISPLKFSPGIYGGKFVRISDLSFKNIVGPTV